MTTLPTHVTRDATLRVKILDACGMTCTFCHDEGTPVAADNKPGLPIVSAGRSGRVSIYAETNGCTFIPGRVDADGTFRRVVADLRDALDLHEMHLTGGEPTLHPDVAGITAVAVEEGYRVRMTSNGERGDRALPGCAAAGLEKVNFSIFGTTPEELAEVQHERYRNPKLAARKIEALQRSIATCVEHGMAANANVVVLDETHIPRVHRILDEWAPQLSVRLLNSLDHGDASVTAIERVLAERGARPVARYVTRGVSGARTEYELPDGRRVFFKQIRPVRLPTTCAGCRWNNDRDCQEGFYGTRLYRGDDGRYWVGVCIQRMDLCRPVEEFLTSSLVDEIRALRDGEEVA
ncbi:MAG TPA: radical SAM protein [Actinotalea caeni]|uniref:radical SAM protein n=1 Tax=Actinotalea caeni TaxID=1348467 RepID=UPI002B4B6311|nr:radical SAM protein [Actinotalea caeni]HLV54610.1 radical SAM protein [Actinotalea caeni]